MMFFLSNPNTQITDHISTQTLTLTVPCEIRPINCQVNLIEIVIQTKTIN